MRTFQYLSSQIVAIFLLLILSRWRPIEEHLRGGANTCEMPNNQLSYSDPSAVGWKVMLYHRLSVCLSIRKLLNWKSYESISTNFVWSSRRAVHRRSTDSTALSITLSRNSTRIRRRRRLRQFFCDNFLSEGVSDVISGVAVELVGIWMSA